METILLTGFEPFAGEALNASWELARRMDGALLDDGSRVIAVQLPWEFGRASCVLGRHLDSLQPHMAVALGQAGGGSDVRLERVAINLDGAPIADNAGQQPIDVPIIVGGATAYFSSLPIKAMVAALRATGDGYSGFDIAQQGYLCMQSRLLWIDAGSWQETVYGSCRACPCSLSSLAGRTSPRGAEHVTGDVAICVAHDAGCCPGNPGRHPEC